MQTTDNYTMIDIVYTYRVDNKHVVWSQHLQVIAELAHTRLKRTVLHKYHTLSTQCQVR